jgi:hypothetical protein
MIPTTSDRDRAFLDYYEFGEIHFEVIAKALRRIDRARENLIAAQNALAAFLQTTNNAYTHQRFAEFYAAGGVTVQDWKARYVDQYQEPDPTLKMRGQLRVIKGSRADGGAATILSKTV